jgi:hypothetical protein
MQYCQHDFLLILNDIKTVLENSIIEIPLSGIMVHDESICQTFQLSQR